MIVYGVSCPLKQGIICHIQVIDKLQAQFQKSWDAL